MNNVPPPSEEKLNIGLPYIFRGFGKTSIFDSVPVGDHLRRTNSRCILTEATGNICLIRLNVRPSDPIPSIIELKGGKQREIKFDSAYKKGGSYYLEEHGIKHNQFDDLIINALHDFMIFIYTDTPPLLKINRY